MKFKIGDRVKFKGTNTHLGFYKDKIYTIEPLGDDNHYAKSMNFVKLLENKDFYGHEKDFILAEKKKNPTYKECLLKLEEES